MTLDTAGQVQKHRIQRTEDLTLAYREARRVQSTHPTFFQNIPAPLSDLAHELGLVIDDKRSDLRQRARLLDRSVSRFAAAHEIGHAILLNKYPGAATRWTVGRREVFASAFAAELLTSPATRARMAASFRTLADPLALLKFASEVGLSPGALLTVAAQERSWIEGLDKVWLRVKYVENAFTRRDPKLRIVSAYYDESRFYIPTNQGLTHLFRDHGWLDSLPVGSLVRHSATITLKFRHPGPVMQRLESKDVLAGLSAVRFQPSGADPEGYLIILADVAPTALTCCRVSVPS